MKQTGEQLYVAFYRTQIARGTVAVQVPKGEDLSPEQEASIRAAMRRAVMSPYADVEVTVVDRVSHDTGDILSVAVSVLDHKSGTVVEEVTA